MRVLRALKTCLAFPAFALGAICVLVAGCSTVPQGDARDVPEAKNSMTDSPSSAGPAVEAPESILGKAWQGEYRVLITSEPAGSVVVINGIPVGTTPRRVLLPGNAQGFSQKNVSIRVRFIAASPAEKSQTVEQKLTPLDKIPEEIRFKREGAERVLGGAN